LADDHPGVRGDLRDSVVLLARKLLEISPTLLKRRNRNERLDVYSDMLSSSFLDSISLGN